jgi:predicted  nucleic acid-binding Zn-ribbon protein
MKAFVLTVLFLASVTVVAQHNARAESTASTAANNCKQDLNDAIQRQKEEVTDLQSEIARLRALLTMLRSNAGIVSDSSLRNALQVDADMWESLIDSMQKQVTRLLELMQDEDAKIKIRCQPREAPTRR